MLFGGVLHAKNVRIKGKDDGSPFMRPQPGVKGDLAIALFVQAFTK